MIIQVLDTETTGMDPASDRVVEIAAVPVRGHYAGETPDGVAWEVLDGAASLVSPGKPIPPEASGIHHIIDADVVDAPQLWHALDIVLGPMWGDHVTHIAAHNCRFDRDMLPPLRDKIWIDTYRCALHIWPDAPDFKNNTLRYYLGIELPRDVPMHRALPDAIVTAHVLIRLLQVRSVDDLHRLSQKSVLLKKMPLGEFRGKPWAEVPTGFLEWMERKGMTEWEPDVRLTLRTELARRRNPTSAA